jgi:hypothetical protein
VFENRALGRIFAPEEHEIIGSGVRGSIICNPYILMG